MYFGLGELSLRGGDLTQSFLAICDSYLETERMSDGEAFFQ